MRISSAIKTRHLATVLRDRTLVVQIVEFDGLAEPRKRTRNRFWGSLVAPKSSAWTDIPASSPNGWRAPTPWALHVAESQIDLIMTAQARFMDRKAKGNRQPAKTTSATAPRVGSYATQDVVNGVGLIYMQFGPNSRGDASYFIAHYSSIKRRNMAPSNVAANGNPFGSCHPTSARRLRLWRGEHSVFANDGI